MEVFKLFITIFTAKDEKFSNGNVVAKTSSFLPAVYSYSLKSFIFLDVGTVVSGIPVVLKGTHSISENLSV